MNHYENKYEKNMKCNHILRPTSEIEITEVYKLA